jgi:hypothetical protein
VWDHVHTTLSPQGGELSPRGSWGICVTVLPEGLTLNEVAQKVLAVAIWNVPLANPSHHTRITISGHMVTKCHVRIQANVVCMQIKGTNVKQQRPTIWEGPKSTGTDL